MEIVYLKETSSTHTYIKEHIKNNGFSHPLAIVTQNQTQGIGSQNNSWDGKKGNLFFSFVINRKSLPTDLPIQSASIYFSFILKEILESKGSKVWLKWPNDFYIEDKKIGGTITTLSGDLFYCGIGINLYKVNDIYGFLDINISAENLLNDYFSSLEEYPTWKKIFSKFQIEFYKNNNYQTNIKNKRIVLNSDMLQADGSLLVNGEKVFSLR